MFYFWLIVLILLNAGWLVLVVFGLPGTWLMVISTALFAWWFRDEQVFSGYCLIAVTVLAAVGEVIEFLGGLAGAQKGGASYRGSLGALLGGILGGVLGTFLIPVPLLGPLLGAAIGAGLGAWSMELGSGKDRNQLLHLGLHAGLGRLLGTGAKLLIGLLIWIIITIAAFWP